MFDNENRRECQDCKMLNNAETRLRLKTMPRVLIVHMKRFDLMGNKLDCSVNVPQEFEFKSSYMNEELARRERNGWVETKPVDLLDVSFKRMQRWADYEFEPEQFRQHSYRLTSMIVHQGDSSVNGHYFSVVRVPGSEGAHWVKFNDDKTTFVDATLKQYTEKAYLLFYEKVWKYPPPPSHIVRQRNAIKQQINAIPLFRAKTMIHGEVMSFDQGLALHQKQSTHKVTPSKSPVVVDMNQPATKPILGKRSKPPKLTIDLTEDESTAVAAFVSKDKRVRAKKRDAVASKPKSLRPKSSSTSNKPSPAKTTRSSSRLRNKVS